MPSFLRSMRWLVVLASLALVSFWPWPISAESPLSASSGVASSLASESSAAGAVLGAFDVSSIGAATYLVGLNLPPGTGGMHPQIGVLYDSQSAEGVLGLGFSLTGLSSITRCAATEALDGYVGVVGFDSRDRFCLDGERLILVSDDVYGSDGSVYHTEKETWTRVVAEGVCGSGPCSFVATNRDGWSLDFGTESDSRLTVPSRSEVIAWQIARTTDLNGNSVLVEYQADESLLQNNPSVVRYTANVEAGLEPQRAVYFDYEDRPDDVQKYQGGLRFVGSQRLNAVRTEVFDSSSEVWQPVTTYRFDYQTSPSTGRSLLTSIEACATETDACLAPTSFEWQQTTAAVTSANGTADGTVATGWCTGNESTLGSGDFDGDGRPDLLCIDGGTPYVLLSTGTGTASPNGTADGQLTLPAGWCDGDGQAMGWADFDADQLVDLVCAGDSVYQVLISDGTTVSSPNSRADGSLDVSSGWCPSEQPCQAGWTNFDGDGRADLACSCTDGRQQVLVSDGKQVSSPNSAADGTVATAYCSNSGARTFWSDFNGDGMSDLFCRDSGMQSVLVSTGSELESPNNDASGTLITSWCGDDDSVSTTADFNGDGLEDLACHGSDGTQQVLLSTETDLASPNDLADGTVVTDWCSGDPTSVDWGDFDADGLADLFCHGSDGTQQVLISDGSGLLSPVSSPEGTIATDWCASGIGAVDDFDGNAMTDLRCFDASTGEVSVLLHDDPFPDLLTGIVNGLGGSYEIVYRPLTSDGVYSRDGEAEYPVLEVRTPVYVVEQYTESDGRGGDYSFGYHYTGARVHLELRRWLGFRSIERTDLADGRYTVTEYIQDYPVIQFIERTAAYSATGTLLASAETSPVVTSSYDEVYQVLRASELSSTYTNGQPDFVYEKTYQYDDYGNPILISDLGDEEDPDDDVFDCWKYLNQASADAWAIGYQLEHKTTRSSNGCLDFLDSEDPAWNPETDLRWDTTGYDAAMNPTDLSAYDDVNGIWLTQGSTYDAYGNSVTMTDWGGNSTLYTFDEDTFTFAVRVQSPENDDGVVLETSFSWDPRFGVLVSETDPNGNRRRIELDDFGRMIEIWGPDPVSDSGEASMQLARYTYGSDTNGTYSEVRDRPNWQNGDVSDWPWARLYVDGLGRPVTTRALGPDGSQIVITEQRYDELRRPYRTSVPRFDGETTSWTETFYDDLDRPVRIVQPDGTVQTIEYLRGELETRSVLAAGTDDARESLSQSSVREVLLQSTASNGGSVRYRYDPLLRVTEVVGANGDISTFDYDSLSRMISSSDPDSGSLSLVYDQEGLLASTTDGEGNITEYSYDALGRIVRKRLHDAQGASSDYLFFYDQTGYTNPKGNLTSVIGPESNYEFGYTRYGLVATEHLELEGESWVQQSEYDPSGESTRLVYPDGSVRTATYDGRGNLRTLELTTADGEETTTVASYTDYSALDEVLAVEYGNRTTTAYSYYPYSTDMGRLESIRISDPDGGNLYQAGYAWNGVGQVAEREEARGQGSASQQIYTYDAMGWLTQASGPTGIYDYAYDTAGNLTLKDGVEYSYAADTNQLVSGSNGLQASYDGNGNLATLNGPDGDWQYSYDAESNLIRIDRNGSAASRIGYDFAGRRITRVDQDGNRSIYVSGDYDVFQADGQELHTRYIDGPDGRIAAMTSEATPTKTLAFRNRAALRAADLFDTSTAEGALRAGLWHLRALGFAMRLHSGAGLWVLMIGLVIGGLRKVAGPEPGRRRRSTLVLLMIFVLLADPLLSPSMAELAPGEGYPEPGLLYFHGDLTRNNVLVTDTAGQTSSVVAYLPFGAIDESESDGPNDFRPKFSGQEHDYGTGLYYFGSRYFHPELGRFVQPDPQTQYWSPYVYVGNDPLSLIDPDGEVAVAVVVGALAAAGAVAGAYAGGAAINHDPNPAHWDWQSADTYAGIFAGAAIGAAGGAAGGAAASAGVTAGILGEIAISAAEAAAFTALGGGSPKEITTSALEGAAFGAVSAGVAAGVGRLARGSRFSGRGGSSLAENGGAAGRAARRAGASADLGTGMGIESRALRRADSGAASSRLSGSSDFEDFGTCGGFSFTADTEVATPQGPKSIADLEPGDQVLGRRADGSADVFGVLATYRRTADRSLRIGTASGEIETTAEHPFWVEDRGWIAARDLRVGDSLSSLSGDPIPIVEIATSAEPITVHNFEVAEARNYFVGDSEVLVHNPPTNPCFTGKKTVRKKKGKGNARLTAVGNTPGKNSRTGRQVNQRMRRDGLIRTVNGKDEVKVLLRAGGTKQWVPLDANIAMGHIEDAVKWWNRTGWQYGARSKEVRKWMLDPDNYEFEWGPLNSSNGGKINYTHRYRRPEGWPKSMGWPPP